MVQYVTVLLSVSNCTSGVQLVERKSQAKFVTFSVNSKADLDSMRTALGNMIEYMEADLTAFTSIRAFTEAAGTGANRDIAPAEVAVMENVPVLPDLKLQGASMEQFNKLLQQSTTGKDTTMQGTARAVHSFGITPVDETMCTLTAELWHESSHSHHVSEPYSAYGPPVAVSSCWPPAQPLPCNFLTRHQSIACRRGLHISLTPFDCHDTGSLAAGSTPTVEIIKGSPPVSEKDVVVRLNDQLHSNVGGSESTFGADMTAGAQSTTSWG
jgi:hypothetical protein